MSGGELELAFEGGEMNVYLQTGGSMSFSGKGNPQSFFTGVYPKYHEFAQESVELELQQHKLSLTEETVWISEIKHYGDLVQNMALTIKLPVLKEKRELEETLIDSTTIDYTTKIIQSKWIDHIGCHLIRKAELIIGNDVIETLTGEWIQIKNQLTRDDSEETIGDLKTENNVTIPLPFSLAQIDSSIPLTALRLTKILVRLYINPLHELIRFRQKKWVITSSTENGFTTLSFKVPNETTKSIDYLLQIGKGASSSSVTTYEPIRITNSGSLKAGIHISRTAIENPVPFVQLSIYDSKLEEESIIVKNISNRITTITDATIVSAVTQWNEWLKTGDITDRYLGNMFLSDISFWDVSQVTNMFFLFKEINIGDHYYTDENTNFSAWNTSNVTSMFGTFWNARLNPNVSNWNVSKVENMEAMFMNSLFDQDISGWDTSKVTLMLSMFRDTHCNPDVSNWDVSKVKHFGFMFRDNTLFNQDVSGWNVSSSRSFSSMFYNCTSFNQDLSSWTPPASVIVGSNTVHTTFLYMIYNTQSLVWRDLSTWTTINENDWFGSHGTGTSFFTLKQYKDATKINQGNLEGEVERWIKYVDGTSTEVLTMLSDPARGNIKKWNVEDCTNFDSLFNRQHYPSNVSTTVANVSTDDGMQSLSGVIDFNKVGFETDLSIWDTSNVTSMRWCFYQQPLFNGNITQWNTSKVSTMYSMFCYCDGFNQDVSAFDMTNVTSITHMFRGTIFNHPLTNWNTVNLVYMSYTFFDNLVFNQPIDWPISTVWYATGMFDLSDSPQKIRAFNQDVSAANWKSFILSSVSPFWENNGVSRTLQEYITLWPSI